MQCERTLTGQHQWSYRQRQIRTVHPTIKESWLTYVGCVCGVEAPSQIIPAIKKQWRETKEAGRWHGERGEQASLFTQAD